MNTAVHDPAASNNVVIANSKGDMKRFSMWFAGPLLLVILLCVDAFAQVPAQTVIEVPFEFVHGSILIQTRVNGLGPFWMMLDTGADPSIVELGTAKSAGLKIAASGQQGTAGGTDINLSYETSLPLVQLGSLTATHVDALAMDLSK